MARSLTELLDDFVMPLLGGGPLQIGAPLRARDLPLMLEEARELQRPELRFLRLRRGQDLVADPELPDPDPDELELWAGLYNTLVFEHPDRRRVWSRAAVWRRVEGTTRSLLTLPAPTSVSDALMRHVSVGAFVDLVRRDMVVSLPTGGELRAVGQELPRRIMRIVGPADGLRHEQVRWVDQVTSLEAQRLLEDALRASPLTCVLRPLVAPPGWSPLWAADAFVDRAMVRAICHEWARQRDWVAVGGAVAGALLPSLPNPSAIDTRAREGDTRAREGDTRTHESNMRTRDGDTLAHDGHTPREGERLALPGAVLPADPGVLAGVAGALVHLHFLKVLELDARLGVAAVSRDPGVTAFLALPLLLPWLGTTTGTPLHGLVQTDAQRPGRDHVDAPIARRWTEYVDHLQELVPKSAVDNLLASLVPRIVQTP